MRVVNRTSGAVLGDRIARAETFVARARGLLGRPPLAAGEGLWIEPCSSIHMFGMRSPIDAIFVDADRRITRIFPKLAPWRIAFGGRRARAVLEVAAGTIDASPARVGDVLDIER